MHDVAWRGMWICVRSKDAQKQLARTSLNWTFPTVIITLHFHLHPQYKYELFHINFTLFHCTGRYELNKLTSLSMCGFIAQLVEHPTGIAEVTGSNPVEALIFFQASSFQLLKLELPYCDDHSSLSSTSAVQI